MSGDVIARLFDLPREVPPILGVGAFLKNTVCVASGRQAAVSHAVGNLDTVEAVLAFEETVSRILEATGATPVAVAHDLHPDFPSSRFAAELGVETVAVQHHHAHVAAVMAEHGLEGPILGLSLDGFGLGPGNQSWGGELLRVDAGGFERLGHLAPLKQPGGDAAARQPWRMGAAALYAMGRGGEIAGRYARSRAPRWSAACWNGRQLPADIERRTPVRRRLRSAGVKLVAGFEGEAPMELESLVTHPQIQPGGWRLRDGVLDLLPLLRSLSEMDAGVGADLFHGTLTAALADWVVAAAERTGIRDVAFCGGCFLNSVLREGLAAALESKRLTPRIARAITPGDGAISLGQAWAVGLLKS